MDTITELAARISSGELTATDAVTEALERMEVSELNAFTSVDPFALERAAVIDEAIEDGATLGPLAGVPIAVKDLMDHEGRINTRGSSIVREPATTTATSIRRIEEAGGVVIGRTGLHEYAFGFSSENQWHGPVRNPWDLSLSPGGSSGGSAAAVAGGLAPGALGTDTGGSVRVPAALCGIVGLKVTHGRIPISGVYPLAPSIDTVGPFARTVDDAALLYAVMAGRSDDDPWTMDEAVEAPRRLEIAGLRFGFLPQWTATPLADDIDAAWRGTIEWLGDVGATVQSIEIEDLDLAGRMVDSYGYEVAHVHRDHFTKAPETYSDEVGKRIRSVFDTTFDQYLEALAWRRKLRRQFDRALADVDVLITPSVASTRKEIGVDTITIGGEAAPYRMPLSRFSAPVNHAGLPAIALPLSFPGTPPPSLQIIGRAWSEARLIGVAAALERDGLVECRRPPNA